MIVPHANPTGFIADVISGIDGRILAIEADIRDLTAILTQPKAEKRRWEVAPTRAKSALSAVDAQDPTDLKFSVQD